MEGLQCPETKADASNLTSALVFESAAKGNPIGLDSEMLPEAINWPGAQIPETRRSCSSVARWGLAHRGKRGPGGRRR